MTLLECGPTMEFNECGPGCPAKCSDDTNKRKNCTKKCKFGCHCRNGLLLDHYGNCVAPSDCPIFVDKGTKVECGIIEDFVFSSIFFLECGLNTKYSSCATACPARCSDRSNQPKQCHAKCKKGCTCKRGYVLDINGNCILPKDCDKMDDIDD